MQITIRTPVQTEDMGSSSTFFKWFRDTRFLHPIWRPPNSQGFVCRLRGQIFSNRIPSYSLIKYFSIYLTNSATATAYVTGHDRSLTSKMTGWGAVMTGPDQSHTSKMTGWWPGGGLVGDWLVTGHILVKCLVSSCANRPLTSHFTSMWLVTNCPPTGHDRSYKRLLLQNVSIKNFM